MTLRMTPVMMMKKMPCLVLETKRRQLLFPNVHITRSPNLGDAVIGSSGIHNHCLVEHTLMLSQIQMPFTGINGIFVSNLKQCKANASVLGQNDEAMPVMPIASPYLMMLA